MEPNPYQSPALPTLAAPVPFERPVVTFDPVRVRALVRPPSVILMALAALSLPFDLVVMSYALLIDAPNSGSDFSTLEGAVVCGAIVVGFTLMLCLHFFVVFGMLQMWRLRSYRHAGLAMAISIVPSISPAYVLGIPVAIWALVVLSKSDVRAAFSS